MGGSGQSSSVRDEPWNALHLQRRVRARLPESACVGGTCDNGVTTTLGGTGSRASPSDPTFGPPLALRWRADSCIGPGAKMSRRTQVAWVRGQQLPRSRALEHNGRSAWGFRPQSVFPASSCPGQDAGNGFIQEVAWETIGDRTELRAVREARSQSTDSMIAILGSTALVAALLTGAVLGRRLATTSARVRRYLRSEGRAQDL